MRKPSSAPSRSRATLSSGQSILALEKRIAFDGAAVATVAKAMAHAVDANRPNGLLHDPYSETMAGVVATPRGDVAATLLGRSLTQEVLHDTWTSTQPKSVVFIESDVPDVKTLIKDIDPSARIVMLDASKDGVDAIASYLATHQGIQNVYIFSHGSDAHLSLGTADLDGASMQGRYAADLATIKSSLGANANILVYGCDFAQLADGDGAAHLLSTLTGAAVGASTNLTGGAAFGGDFVLEDRIGAFTAPDILSPSIARDYQGVLANPTTLFATSGTGLYRSNIEFLTYANTTLATGGITNGATATYTTAEGGTVTVTFSNVSNATNAAAFKPAAFSAYAPSKFYGGYNNTSSTSEILYGGYSGTTSFTITFTAVDKNGISYKPNVVFADSEVTDASGESYNVTTNGGNFQNVETVGASGYSLSGIGTQSFTLSNTGGGVPVIVSDAATSLNVTVAINGGKEGFALGLVVPTLSLDANASSGAAARNYQTTYTEKGAAVAIGDTDVSAVEPGLANATSAKIVLTNAQAGDVLAANALPAGITSSIDTSVAGQITVNLSGSASLANYQTAIQDVTFASTSGNPSTVDRVLNVTFNDGGQDSNTAVSTVHVTAVNDAPVEVVPGAQTTNKDTALSISGLTVSDVDANGGTETVTLSVADGTISLASTTGLTFSTGTGTNDTTETFTGTLSAINNAIASVKYQPKTGYYGSDTLTFTTNDNGNTGTGGAMSTSASVALTVKNVSPAANGTLANKSYTDGQSGISIATAQGFTDSLGLPLTYSATGLPAGLTIDAATGKITGTIDHDASKNAPTTTGSGATLDGKYTIIETADDGQSGTTTQTFTIDSTNQAPVVGTKTATQTNNDGDTITAVDASKAFSDPNGDPLTYTASNLPAGLTISGAGLITGTVAKNATPGTYAVVVTGTDDKGAATTETFNWVVKDVPPVAIGTLANQAYTDGQAGISLATSQGFTDSNGNALTYSATGLPKGLTINAATGQITGTVDHDASKNAPTTTGSGATLDGKYSIVVTANDGLGGSATQTFTIDSSNQAPIQGTTTANQSSNDGQTITPVDTSLAFSDPNAGDVLTYTVSNLPAGLSIDSATGKISGTIAGNAAPGSYAVRVVATDDKGAAARETFTWTIGDVPPTVTTQLPNQTYVDSTPGISIKTSPGFNSPNGLPLVYTATGLPAGLSIDSATGVITGALDHDASKDAPSVKGSGATLDGTYTVTVAVSDGQGGTAAQMFTIDATNSAPVIAHQTPDQHSADGGTASVDAAAAFADQNTGDALVYAVTGLPPGLSISTSTGLISGTIDSNASKTSPYSVTVSVTDDKGAVATETFAWTVENVVPVATPPLADRAAYDGNSLSYTTADGFTNPNGLALTYTATGLPKGVTINATTGVISGTLDHDASVLTNGGAYTIAVTVDDGQGGMATNTFHLTVTNQAPVLTTATPNQTAVDGQPIATVDASRAFTDPNGDPLTFTASNLPAGLSIDSAGKITGTIAANVKPRTYTTTVSATDDKGLVSSETFTWTISDVAPVTNSSLPAGRFPDSSVISIDTASGFISPNGLVLTYSATGLPAGVAIDPATGKITGQLYHDASNDAPTKTGSGATLDGTYTILVTATDGQGGAATQSFTLDATNTAPTLVTNTPTQSGPNGAKVSVDAAAAFVDPNVGDVVTYTASGLPPGLAIDPASGLITGTLAATASKTDPYAVTVTATDDKGAATSEQFTWHVTDVAPVATGALSDRATSDGAVVSYATANAFADPNGPPLTYSATGLPAGLTIDPTTGVISGTVDRNASTVSGGIYAISVTVDDGQGGTATSSFHLTSTNQAPKVQAPTANQTNTDGQAITPVSVATAFADSNGDPLTYTASNLPKGLSIDASGTISGTVAVDATPGVYSVTIVATDSKGVATPETFTWTIADAPPTVASTLGGQAVVDSQSGISIATAGGFSSPNGLPLRYSATGLPAGLAIDAGTGLITGTIDHDASANAPARSGSGATLDGTYAVTVTVSDGQGGTAQQTFAIDSTNQAPTLVTSVSLDQHGTAGNTAQVNTAIAFTDPNMGDVLTYSATNLPTGLTINGATGLITGTIDSAAGSATPYSVAVTATDDKGAAVTKTISWTVDPQGTGPTPIPNISLYDGSTPAPIETASHFSNPNNATLVYSATGLPSGLTINSSTGEITGTVNHDASKNGANPTGSGATLDSTYSVTVNVFDVTLGATPTFRTFVIDVANQAPVVTTKTVDQTTGSGQAITPVDTSTAFSDPNGDTLTYAVAGLPTGLSFETSTGRITGTTAVGSAGTYAVTVTATDDKGAATTERFAWTVSDTAPAIAGTLANKSYADSTSGISIDASMGFSSPNGLTLTYTVAGLPAGLSIDRASGLITGTLDHDASKAAPGGAYAVTVTASDGHGGMTAQTFTLDATNDAPAVTTQTSTQHGADGSKASIDVASAFKDPNLGDGLTYSATGLPPGLAVDSATGLISGTIDKSASKSGPYSVTVTATDDKGAATSETFTYAVGTVPPIAVPLGDLSAYDASIVSIPTVNGFTNPNSQTLTYSATGLPSGLSIDPATGLISGTLSRDASTATSGGVYTIAVTANDGQGGVDVNTFHVVATNQTPVVVTQTADQTSSDGQVITPLDASKAFKDPNGDPVTYSASNLPKGLSIDPITGKISGTVSATAATTTGLVTVTATDDKGAAESETFLWTVNDTAPAKIGVIAPQSFADSTSGVSIATAGTFANPKGLTYAYSATGLPAGLTIDPKTGIIGGQLGHDASANAPATMGAGATLDGTYTVVVSAYDGQGGTSTQVFTIDAKNGAPTVVARTADPLGYNGRTASLDVGAAFLDPNAGDTLTFAATGLPAGLAIDPATGLITGTIDKMASTHGPYSVVVTATDDKGAATTETFVWTIDNIAPIATPPLPNLATYDSATLRLATATGFTNPNALALAYTATGLPAGLAIDGATGIISGTLDHDASVLVTNGRYTVAVTASDGLGGSAVNTFILTASNQAPVVVAPTPDQVVTNGQVVTPVDVSKAFKDPNGDSLTYAAYNLPTNLSIDPTSGKISGTVGGAVVPGTYEVTVLATDDKGAVSSETFHYVVDDNPPVKTGTLANQMYADSTGNVRIPTAGGFTSPNGDSLTFTAAGLPRGLTIDPTTGVISGFISHDSSKNAPVTTGFGVTLEGIYTVTITASDGLGGFATQAFMIETANQAPTLGTPTNAQVSTDRDTIALDASHAFADPNVGDVVTYAAMGLPKGLTIDPASGLITGTIDPAASASGPYSVVVTATDDKGAATSETFAWTVADLAPTATSSPAAVTTIDGATVAPIDTASHVVNPNGLPLTYAATGLPAGLSIDPTTGLITGTIDHDASKNAPVTSGSGATLDGTYTIVVTASDGQGGVATQTFTLDATNQAPVVGTATADQSGTDGDRVSLAVAKAFVDANVGDDVTYAATGLPKGLTIDPATGLISGTIDPAASASGPYSVVVTATDDKGAATNETFAWTVADLAPTATSSPAAMTTIDGATLSPIDTASHVSNPNGLPLTYAATGLPAGLTIDPTTGLITGTIDHDASKNAPVTSGSGATLDGTYTIVVTASDGQGGVATETFTLDSKNSAPVVGTATADQSSTDRDTITLDASHAFADPNVGDVVTYAATGLPRGLTIDPASGLITGTIDPAASASGPYSVVVTATDDKGAATSETFAWTVADLAPSVTSSPAAVTTIDGATVAPIDTASHVANPNGLPLTYAATGLPAGLSIDPTTGLITGTIDHDASKNAPVTSGSGATLDGTYTIVVTASDGQGGVATETFTLDAKNTAPVVGTATADQSNAAGDTVSVGTDVADPNGDPLTYSATGLPLGLTIDAATGHIAGTIAPNADVGAYQVTVFVTDDKGAVVTEHFVWTVDDVAPYATDAIPDVSASEGLPLPPIDAASHFANPGGLPLTYGATGLPRGLSIDPVTGLVGGTIDHEASRLGPYTIVVTADDGRGGIATQTFTLDAVNDAPVVGTPTSDQTARPGQTVPALDTGSAFQDPNGDTLVFSAQGLPPGLTIDPATGLISGTVAIGAARGGYVVTVTAHDDKGAAASETFDWYVDSVAPDILGQPSFVPFVTSPVAAHETAQDRPASADLHADGAVLDAVNAISGDQEQSLVIRADEIVVSTVNNVRPLDGLQDLNVAGAGIVRSGAAANERGDRYGRAGKGFGFDIASEFASQTAPDEVLGSSLRDSSVLHGDAGATINIETLIHDRVLTIALDNLSDKACVVPVASYSVTRADGSPLPAWLHTAAKNVLVGKIPSGVEAIDLKIKATLANGIVRERHVTIGTNSGTIRPVAAPSRHEGRLLSDMVAARTVPVGRGLGHLLD